MTVYGLYARETGGWLSVAALVKLLAQCDVEEPVVRSSIFRLKRRGLLAAVKVDNVAGYGLTDEARAILDEGDRRIFERRRASAADGWLLAVFSVPESERDKRHVLRTQLTRLGFGTVSAGVWIAPAHVFEEAHETLERHGLNVYVDLFRADHLAFSDTLRRVPEWWDLGRLRSLYDDFLQMYSPVLATYRRRRSPVEPARAFTDYVTALTDWRRLPYAEPGLPAEVLPAGWTGQRAADTFFELRSRLSGPAHRFVDEIR